MRGRAILVAFFFASCARETKPASTFPLSAVVASAREAAESRVEVVAEPPAPSEETREVVIGLASSLSTSDAMLRNAVLDDLRSLGAAAIPVLSEILGDEKRDRAEHTGAIEALAVLDTPRCAELLSKVVETRREPWLRAIAAARLARSTHDFFLPRIAARLKYEVDSDTVIGIAQALAHHGNYSGVDALRVLRDTATDAAARERADAVLQDLARTVDAQDADALVREWFSGELEDRRPGPEPSDRLRLEAWKQISGLAAFDLRVVDDCRFGIAHMNRWIVEPLAATLHDENVYLRTHAAQCLERMGPRARSAIPALISALADPRLAPAAATALGATRSPEAIEPLSEALDGRRDLELRIAAARALGVIGDSRSREALRRMFDAGETLDMRQAAAQGLVALGEDDGVARFLAECLTSSLADAGSAELALGRWVRTNAERGAAVFEDAWTRWRALEPADSLKIETRDAITERRRARAAILEPLLPATSP